MKYNGLNIDVELAIHSLAVEFAKMDVEKHIRTDSELEHNPTGTLDIMFDSYLRAVGYLSKKSDDYINTLLDNH